MGKDSHEVARVDSLRANDLLCELITHIRQGTLLPWVVSVSNFDGDMLKEAWASADNDCIMSELLNTILSPEDDRTLQVWCGDGPTCVARQVYDRRYGTSIYRCCYDCCEATRRNFGELTIYRLVELVRTKSSSPE